jgi:hypothetical protein
VAAAEAFGGIGYEVEELRGLSEELRAAADESLVGSLAIELEPASDLTKTGCVDLGTGPGEVSSYELSPGQSVALESDGSASVGIRRFADDSDVELGSLAPGDGRIVAVPADGIPDPWQVTTGASARACAVG